MAVDPPLSEDERKVLGVLMLRDRKVADCTVKAIATSIGADFDTTHRALRGLEDRHPQLAHPKADAGLGEQVWFSTSHAADAV